MLKLFHAFGSCSMSCHFAIEEAGIPFDSVIVDFDKHDGPVAELERLNPLKVAPVMVNDQGKTLTQNIAILEYIADLKPSAGLLPAVGSWERSEAHAWFSFVAADLHKSFVPLFAVSGISENEATRTEIKKWATGNVEQLLSHLDQNLAGKDYVLGKFSMVDCYLFTVLNWTNFVGIKTDAYPNVQSYMARCYARPAFQKVLKAGGMLK